jgi:hypothetical protein
MELAAKDAQSLSSSGKVQGVATEKSEVFNGELCRMKYITLKLCIKLDSTPTFLKARLIPYAIRPKVKADLDTVVKNKIL